MNPFLVAAIALLVTLAPCAVVCFHPRSSPVDRLISFELASVIDTLIFLLLAQAFGRSVYFDLAVSLAVLSLAGGLVFAHFMERWV